MNRYRSLYHGSLVQAAFVNHVNFFGVTKTDKSRSKHCTTLYSSAFKFMSKKSFTTHPTLLKQPRTAPELQVQVPKFTSTFVFVF